MRRSHARKKNKDDIARASGTHRIGLRAQTRTRHEINADPRSLEEPFYAGSATYEAPRRPPSHSSALSPPPISHRPDRRQRSPLPLPPATATVAVPLCRCHRRHLYLQSRGTGVWAGGYKGEVEGRRLGGGRRVLRRGNGNGVSSRACRRRLRLPACLPTALTTASRRSSAGTAVHLASRTWREATR